MRSRVFTTIVVACCILPLVLCCRVRQAELPPVGPATGAPIGDDLDPGGGEGGGRGDGEISTNGSQDPDLSAGEPSTPPNEADDDGDAAGDSDANGEGEDEDSAGDDDAEEQPVRRLIDVRIVGDEGTSVEVDPDEPGDVTGEASLDVEDLVLSDGQLQLTLEGLDVIPIGGGEQKPMSVTRSTESLNITVWVAQQGDTESLCSAGQPYGPFMVELDDSLTPISVLPSSVPLTLSTLNLLNDGPFSLCIHIESTVAAEVTVPLVWFDVTGLPVE